MESAHDDFMSLVGQKCDFPKWSLTVIILVPGLNGVDLRSRTAQLERSDAVEADDYPARFLILVPEHRGGI